MLERISQEELERRTRGEAERRKHLAGISSMLALDVVHVDAARQEMVTAFRAAPWTENVNGTVHGGIITVAFDSSMGILCHSTVSPRRGPTIQLNVSFLRPVGIGDTMYVRVRILRTGRNLVWLQGVAWTADEDKPCASAEGTFYIKDV